MMTISWSMGLEVSKCKTDAPQGYSSQLPSPVVQWKQLAETYSDNPKSPRQSLNFCLLSLYCNHIEEWSSECQICLGVPRNALALGSGHSSLWLGVTRGVYWCGRRCSLALVCSQRGTFNRRPTSQIRSKRCHRSRTLWSGTPFHRWIPYPTTPQIKPTSMSADDGARPFSVHWET